MKHPSHSSRTWAEVRSCAMSPIARHGEGHPEKGESGVCGPRAPAAQGALFRGTTFFLLRDQAARQDESLVIFYPEARHQELPETPALHALRFSAKHLFTLPVRSRCSDDGSGLMCGRRAEGALAVVAFRYWRSRSSWGTTACCLFPSACSVLGGI